MVFNCSDFFFYRGAWLFFTMTFGSHSRSLCFFRCRISFTLSILCRLCCSQNYHPSWLLIQYIIALGQIYNNCGILLTSIIPRSLQKHLDRIDASTQVRGKPVLSGVEGMPLLRESLSYGSPQKFFYRSDHFIRRVFLKEMRGVGDFADLRVRVRTLPHI